jgi:hypothetical protein
MVRAFHFLNVDMTSGYGNEPPWSVGERRELPKGQRPILCERGYHSCRTWLNALTYSPGPVACIVEVGRVTRDEDKQVGRWRRLVAAVDASRQLRLFACECAERALKGEREAGREPAEVSWQAIEVARQFANGEATAEELSAAASAAYAAAYSAASAAYSAAYSAAASAADSAASAAYRAADAAAYRAASAAYSAAASAAAYSAEHKWQGLRLAELLAPLFAEAPVVKGCGDTWFWLCLRCGKGHGGHVR